MSVETKRENRWGVDGVETGKFIESECTFPYVLTARHHQYYETQFKNEELFLDATVARRLKLGATYDAEVEGGCCA